MTNEIVPNGKIKPKIWDLHLSFCSGYEIVSNLQLWVKYLEQKNINKSQVSMIRETFSFLVFSWAWGWLRSPWMNLMPGWELTANLVILQKEN